MSKAVKLRNSNFLASTSIVHKRGGGWHYLSSLLDNIYPIGSIFLTTTDTNPSTYFGGTWEQIKGGFLYGCVNSIDNNLQTGNGAGTFDTTLTVNQMPSHSHGGRAYFHGYSGFSGGSSGNVYVFNWSSAECIVNQNSSNTSSYTQLCPQPNTHNAGGGQGHFHKIPHIGVWVWKRVS